MQVIEETLICCNSCSSSSYDNSLELNVAYVLLTAVVNEDIHLDCVRRHPDVLIKLLSISSLTTIEEALESNDHHDVSSSSSSSSKSNNKDNITNNNRSTTTTSIDKDGSNDTNMNNDYLLTNTTKRSPRK
jgi:hypothetical protein